MVHDQTFSLKLVVERAAYLVAGTGIGWLRAPAGAGAVTSPPRQLLHVTPLLTTVVHPGCKMSEMRNDLQDIQHRTTLWNAALHLITNLTIKPY